jgi:hypothetical protein
MLLVLVLLVLYIGSYLALSRWAFAHPETTFATNFWFFEPRDSDLWRVSNYGCVYIYFPLIAIDNWLGTGKVPAAEPLWGLSK